MNTVRYMQEHRSTPSDEKKLLRELCGKIRLTGPISIAEYMREVLTNPFHGVYMDKTVIGDEGHFITSPEIR